MCVFFTFYILEKRPLKYEMNKTLKEEKSFHFPLCQLPCKYLQKILLGAGDAGVYLRNISRFWQNVCTSHLSLSRAVKEGEDIIYYLSLSLSLIAMQKYLKIECWRKNRRSSQVTKDVPLQIGIYFLSSAHHLSTSLPAKYYKLSCYNRRRRRGRGGGRLEPLIMT